MKRSVQLAHIRQLCCLGLGGRAIMPALLKAAREGRRVTLESTCERPAPLPLGLRKGLLDA